MLFYVGGARERYNKANDFFRARVLVRVFLRGRFLPRTQDFHNRKLKLFNKQKMSLESGDYTRSWTHALIFLL